MRDSSHGCPGFWSENKRAKKLFREHEAGACIGLDFCSFVSCDYKVVVV